VAIKDYNIILDLLNGLVKFRSTIVKLYFYDKSKDIPSGKEARSYTPSSKEARPYTAGNKEARPYTAIWRRRGYPKGSKNKSNVYIVLNNGEDMAYIETFIT
jgi:hypothetical protein